MIDKKEIVRLPPQERLKKLKSMEEERKKEVDEIESLIKDSIHELKIDKLADEIAPEQKAVDISRLFEVTNEQRLEKNARQDRRLTPIKNSKFYQTFSQTYQDYSQLKQFYGILSMGGALTQEQMSLIGKIGERINIAESYVPIGEKTASILDASRMVLYKLKKETGLG